MATLRLPLPQKREFRVPTWLFVVVALAIIGGVFAAGMSFASGGAADISARTSAEPVTETSDALPAASQQVFQSQQQAAPSQGALPRVEGSVPVLDTYPEKASVKASPVSPELLKQYDLPIKVGESLFGINHGFNELTVIRGTPLYSNFNLAYLSDDLDLEGSNGKNVRVIAIDLEQGELRSITFELSHTVSGKALEQVRVLYQKAAPGSAAEILGYSMVPYDITCLWEQCEGP